MKQWGRSPLATACGMCGVVIKRGDPCMEIAFVAVATTRLRRCPDCAGEPMPEELPPLTLSHTSPSAAFLQRLRNLLPFDWTARATGDREPGEEG